MNLLFYRIAFVGLLALTSLRPVAAQPWQAWASAEAAGFDARPLNAVRLYADSLQSGAVMVVYQGHVLAAWGDVERSFKAHSVRKSLVSALYGVLVEDDLVQLDATLADLGIDDSTPLTEREKQARVRDLLAARSGIYLPAAYAPSSQDRERPPRGSHAPGTHWFYNNWDFNIVGVIAEQVMGQGLYDSFAARIAQPLGMEDYDPEAGLVVYEPSHSKHPAHTFRISTRDLARVGQLYLQKGRWGDTQVVPERWVTRSTWPISDLGHRQGYGYMWWTYEPGSLGKRYPHANQHAIFLARGTGGQALFIIPSEELVIVHRGDTDHNRHVSGGKIWQMVEQILAARMSTPQQPPALKPMQAVPFESQLPAPLPVEYQDLSPEAWTAYHGTYEIAPGQAMRVFPWEGRTFMFVPGQGEAELFALGAERFTIRVLAGIRIEFERHAAGEVAAVTVHMGRQQVRGIKQ